MALLDAFVGPVVGLISAIINLLVILIIVRVVISYLTVDRYHPIVRTVVILTDLVIKPARRLPHIYENIDFAPVIASLGLVLLGQIISRLYVLLFASTLR